MSIYKYISLMFLLYEDNIRYIEETWRRKGYFQEMSLFQAKKKLKVILLNHVIKTL
jgi:hypothetical protein